MPISPPLTLILVFSFVKSILTQAVSVQVAVPFLGQPYSVGYLNCLSAVKLCEDARVIIFFAFLLSIKFEPKSICKGNPAHAAYTPTKGMLKLLIVWLETPN